MSKTLNLSSKKDRPRSDHFGSHLVSPVGGGCCIYTFVECDPKKDLEDFTNFLNRFISYKIEKIKKIIVDNIICLSIRYASNMILDLSKLDKRFSYNLNFHFARKGIKIIADCNAPVKRILINSSLTPIINEIFYNVAHISSLENVTITGFGSIDRYGIICQEKQNITFENIQSFKTYYFEKLRCPNEKFHICIGTYINIVEKDLENIVVAKNPSGFYYGGNSDLFISKKVDFTKENMANKILFEEDFCFQHLPNCEITSEYKPNFYYKHNYETFLNENTLENLETMKPPEENYFDDISF